VTDREKLQSINNAVTKLLTYKYDEYSARAVLEVIDRLSVVQPPIVYCKACPFAKFLHPTPPEAGGCAGVFDP
jgi:hypothetical protein